VPLVRTVCSVVIDRHIEEVFDHVAREGGPVPYRPARGIPFTVVASDPPARIAWRGRDGADEVEVRLELATVWTATRLTARVDVAVSAPRVLRPMLRSNLRREVMRQLIEIRRSLERGVAHDPPSRSWRW
jgi:hypothetical protein